MSNHDNPRAQSSAAPAKRRATTPAPDDKAMLKAAADLTRDLNVAERGDLLGRPDRLGAARLCGAVRGDAVAVRPLVAARRALLRSSRCIGRAASFTS